METDDHDHRHGERPDGTVTTVQFLDGTTLLGTDTTAP